MCIRGTRIASGNERSVKRFIIRHHCTANDAHNVTTILHYIKGAETMNYKIKAKIGAVLMAAAIAAGAAAMPASATYNNSTTSQRDANYGPAQTYLIGTLRAKFPAGKYWNSGNPDTYTTRPCSSHPSYANCTHVPFRYTVGAGYTALPSNEVYSTLCQCYGFARKLASDFFGGCQVWTRQRTDKNFQIRVGDQIRIRYTFSNGGYSDHSVFVTEANGNSIKYADCNAYGTCQIRWDCSASVHNGGFIDGNSYYSILWVDRPAMAGDVTGDSQITWEDVNAIADIYTGRYSFSGKYKNYIMEAADLNNDGKVTVQDWMIAYSQYSGTGYFSSQRYLTNVGIWT